MLASELCDVSEDRLHSDELNYGAWRNDQVFNALKELSHFPPVENFAIFVWLDKIPNIPREEREWMLYMETRRRWRHTTTQNFIDHGTTCVQTGYRGCLMHVAVTTGSPHRSRWRTPPEQAGTHAKHPGTQTIFVLQLKLTVATNPTASARPSCARRDRARH
jgi:hypothetical protein